MLVSYKGWGRWLRLSNDTTWCWLGMVKGEDENLFKNMDTTSSSALLVAYNIYSLYIVCSFMLYILYSMVLFFHCYPPGQNDIPKEIQKDQLNFSSLKPLSWSLLIWSNKQIKCPFCFLVKWLHCKETDDDRTEIFLVFIHTFHYLKYNVIFTCQKREWKLETLQ